MSRRPHGFSAGTSCRPGRFRTHDPRFWRPVLYPLSYWPILTSLLRLLVRRVFAAMPTKLFYLKAIGRPCFIFRRGIIPIFTFRTFHLNNDSHKYSYSVMAATTPAPTVLPPSRIANRNSFSIAIGVINSTSIDTLSPGITISTFAGNVQTPVTSVVRK